MLVFVAQCPSDINSWNPSMGTVLEISLGVWHSLFELRQVVGTETLVQFNRYRWICSICKVMKVMDRTVLWLTLSGCCLLHYRNILIHTHFCSSIQAKQNSEHMQQLFKPGHTDFLCSLPPLSLSGVLGFSLVFCPVTGHSEYKTYVVVTFFPKREREKVQVQIFFVILLLQYSTVITALQELYCALYSNTACSLWGNVLSKQSSW